jgi:hypothetical protein
MKYQLFTADSSQPLPKNKSLVLSMTKEEQNKRAKTSFFVKFSSISQNHRSKQEAVNHFAKTFWKKFYIQLSNKL